MIISITKAFVINNTINKYLSVINTYYKQYMYMFWKNNPYSGQKSMDLYNNQNKYTILSTYHIIGLRFSCYELRLSSGIGCNFCCTIQYTINLMKETT